MNSARSDRIEVLDGLRGIAAPLVVVHHLGTVTSGGELLPGGQSEGHG